VGGDGGLEPLGGLALEGRRPSATVGLGGERAGLASPLEQASDPRLADREPLGDLGAVVDALVAGGGDPLA